MNKHNKQLGESGEILARRYLEQQGLVFVTQNYHAQGGEIDLIMRDESIDEWVLVEVKTRRTDYYGIGAESITPAKIKKMQQAAERYFYDALQLSQMPYYRIDGVVVDFNTATKQWNTEWYQRIEGEY